MAVLGLPEGTTWHQPLQFLDDNGTPINLTGVSDLVLFIVLPPKTVVLLLTPGSGITIVNAVTGRVRIDLTAAQTENRAGDYEWEASGLTAGGDEVLLGRGDLHIDPTFVGHTGDLVYDLGTITITPTIAALLSGSLVTAAVEPSLSGSRVLTAGHAIGLTDAGPSSTLTIAVSEAALNHNLLVNLLVGDAHTQYALLAGRSGGQTLFGGTGASDQLVLGSTSNGTKGGVTLGIGDWLNVSKITAPSASIDASHVSVYADDFHGEAQLSFVDSSGLVVGLGRSLYATVRNTNAGTITKGQVVKIVGSTGNAPDVDLVRADSVTDLDDIFVVAESIAHNGWGRILIYGLLTMDTSAFLQGADLYVSETVAGDMQSALPTRPNHAIHLGEVLMSGVGNGVLFVHSTLPVGHWDYAGLTTGDDHTQYTRKDTLTTTGDIYYASSANTPNRLALTVPAANVRNVLGVDNGETVPTWKTTLDGTAPTTIAANTAAASGTSLIFSHRDHVHGTPATYPATAHNVLSATHGDSLAASVADGSIIIGNVTPAWSSLAISVPAANVRNVLGVDNGETRPSWKTALDGTNPTTIVVNASASPGTSLVFSHRDHTHGSPATWTATAHNIFSAIHADTTGAASPVDGDTIIGNVIPAWSKLAISVPAANVLNVLGVANGETRPSWKTALDNTAPTTIGVSDVAVAGTSLVFAHRDHQHGSPATWPATAHNIFSATHGDTTGAASPVDGDIIIGNVTPAWSKLAISVPAANVRNVLGVDNGETRPSWKTALDGTNPTTIAANTAASPGTSLVFAHRDHIHGTPATYPATAHNILSATHGDTLAASVVDGDVMIGNVTPAWSRLAITVPAANVLNVLGVANGETRPSWKTALDGTAPTTIGVSDAAAAGTALVFAHRDHKHGSPATFPATAHNIFSATHGDTTGAASPVDGDIIIGNITPAWSKLAISVPAANVRNVLGVDNGETRPSWKTALDGTTPSAITDTGAAGTSLVFAHRDHAHSGSSYAILAGRAGGQQLDGDTASGGNLTLMSTAHSTKGKLLFGTSGYNEATNFLGLGTASPDAPMHIHSVGAANTLTSFIVDPTVDSVAGVARNFWVHPTYTVNASSPAAVIGGDVWCTGAPAGGRTLPLLIALEVSARTSNTGGALTDLRGLYVAPGYDTIKPGTAYGIFLDNHGSASITTAIGLHLAAQSGAANNYDVSFGTVNTAAAGAYYGKVPVLYNGLLKYLHVFS